MPNKEGKHVCNVVPYLRSTKSSLRKNLVYFLEDFLRESALTLALNFVAANRKPCSAVSKIVSCLCNLLSDVCYLVYI